MPKPPHTTNTILQIIQKHLTKHQINSTHYYSKTPIIFTSPTNQDRYRDLPSTPNYTITIKPPNAQLTHRHSLPTVDHQGLTLHQIPLADPQLLHKILTLCNQHQNPHTPPPPYTNNG